jgi:hypothetical protein
MLCMSYAASHAMGCREGDTLTISNQWESVIVVRCKGPWWVLDGAEQDTRYASPGAALDAALAYLATFAQGRCD